MIDHGTAVEFELNPKKGLQRIPMAVFTAAILALFGHWSGGREGLLFSGGLGLLVIAASLFAYIRMQQDRSVRLRLDAFGLLAQGAGAEEPVPWSRISRIDFVLAQRQALFMRVMLNGPADAVPPAKNLLVTIVRLLMGAPIAVPLDDLVGEPQDVIAAVQRFSPSTHINF